MAATDDDDVNVDESEDFIMIPGFVELLYLKCQET